MGPLEYFFVTLWYNLLWFTFSNHHFYKPDLLSNVKFTSLLLNCSEMKGGLRVKKWYWSGFCSRSHSSDEIIFFLARKREREKKRIWLGRPVIVIWWNINSTFGSEIVCVTNISFRKCGFVCKGLKYTVLLDFNQFLAITNPFLCQMIVITVKICVVTAIVNKCGWSRDVRYDQVWLQTQNSFLNA